MDHIIPPDIAETASVATEIVSYEFRAIPNNIAYIRPDLAAEGARLVEAIVRAGVEPHETALGAFGCTGA